MGSCHWSARWPELKFCQGVTVKVAVFVVLLSLPDTVTDVEAVTVVVVTVKVAVVAPAGTVTLAGNVAADVLLLVSVTTVPAEGAGPFRVTVPVEEVPPVTLDGLTVSEVSAGRSTVKVAVLVVLLSTAEIVTEVLADTGVVAIVNVAVVAPAATVTLAGTVAADVLLLVKVTTAPLAGAAPVRVTVPVEDVPPTTLEGLSETEVGTGARTVKVAVLVVPLRTAEIVTDVLAVTGVVVMANVAVVAPPATVTLTGTVAADVLLLVKVTTAPPAGAAPVRITVPVEDAPPYGLVGLSETEEGTAGRTVNVAVFVAPFRTPEIVTDVLADTGVVVMEKVAVVAPAATVTLAGTVAADVLLLLKVTTVPPVGAAPLSVTVPVEDAPPYGLVGLSETVESATAFTVSVAFCVAL